MEKSTARTVNVAENIRKLREAGGITQKELADKLGINQSVVAAYELGTKIPSLRILADMARVFEVTSDDVLFKQKEG